MKIFYIFQQTITLAFELGVPGVTRPPGIMVRGGITPTVSLVFWRWTPVTIPATLDAAAFTPPFDNVVAGLKVDTNDCGWGEAVRADDDVGVVLPPPPKLLDVLVVCREWVDWFPCRLPGGEELDCGLMLRVVDLLACVLVERLLELPVSKQINTIIVDYFIILFFI